MRVVICGAGQVGFGIAERLAAEENDVSVIDTSPQLIQAIRDTLDVRGFVGHGAHPDVLAQAGVDQADMIIAVTLYDEVNMVACQVAHSLFNVPTKIARIRAQSYLAAALGRPVLVRAPADRRDHLAGDRGRRDGAAPPRSCPAPSTSSRFANGEVVVVGIDCARELPGRRHAAVAAHRAVPRPAGGGRRHRARRQAVRAASADSMLVGDHVYVVCAARAGAPHARHLRPRGAGGARASSSPAAATSASIVAAHAGGARRRAPRSRSSRRRASAPSPSPTS